jgi:hypothetical protein
MRLLSEQIHSVSKPSPPAFLFPGYKPIHHQSQTRRAHLEYYSLISKEVEVGSPRYTVSKWTKPMGYSHVSHPCAGSNMSGPKIPRYLIFRHIELSSHNCPCHFNRYHKPVQMEASFLGTETHAPSAFQFQVPSRFHRSANCARSGFRGFVARHSQCLTLFSIPTSYGAIMRHWTSS